MPHGSAQIRRLEWRGIAIWAGDAELVGYVGSGAGLGGRFQHACRLLQQCLFLSLQSQLRQHNLFIGTKEWIYEDING